MPIDRRNAPQSLPIEYFSSTEYRRVQRTLRVWIAGVPDDQEPIPEGSIEPIGEPVLIGPLELLQILRRIRVVNEKMALIVWCDTLYLALDRDLEIRTKQCKFFRAAMR
jgi:hypothetical protein